MRGLRQVLAAYALGARATLVRPRHALLALAGFFIGTGMLVGLLTVPRAIEAAAAATGAADTILLIGSSSNQISLSTVPAETTSIAAALPSVAQAAPELILTKRLPRPDGTKSDVLIRGVANSTVSVAKPSLHVIAGRRFKPGSNEIMVGREAAAAFPQLRPGARVHFADTLWRVSGIFAAGGGLWESEIRAPLALLQSAAGAQGKLSVVRVRLKAGADVESLKRQVQRDPRLDVRLEREQAYYARQVVFLVSLARSGAWIVSILLGVAALLAIGNAVSLGLVARRKELAVLRAIGFERASLAVALVAEVLMVALVGAGVASLVAWQLLDGASIVTSAGGYSLAVSVNISLALVAIATAFALALGFLSAIGPCWAAIGRPLGESLRRA